MTRCARLLSTTGATAWMNASFAFRSPNPSAAGTESAAIVATISTFRSWSSTFRARSSVVRSSPISTQRSGWASWLTSPRQAVRPRTRKVVNASQVARMSTPENDSLAIRCWARTAIRVTIVAS